MKAKEEKFAIVFVKVNEQRDEKELKVKLETVLGKENIENFWIDDIVDGDDLVGS